MGPHSYEASGLVSQDLKGAQNAARTAPQAFLPLDRFGAGLGLSPISPVAILPISMAFCTVSAWRFSPWGL
jgi:hypothetical protein